MVVWISVEGVYWVCVAFLELCFGGDDHDDDEMVVWEAIQENKNKTGIS